MRTSFHHQPEAQHPKSSAIHKLAGRLPHLLGHKRTNHPRPKSTFVRTGDGWIKTTSPHARIVTRCRSEKKAERSALQRFGRHDLDAEAAEADVSELAGCEQADR